MFSANSARICTNDTFNSWNNDKAFSSLAIDDNTNGSTPLEIDFSMGWTPIVWPAITRCNLLPIFRIVYFCNVVALLLSRLNQSANLLSSGLSVSIFATVPIWTLVKSYSSKIGIGAAPSRKTRGLIVIFLGSERFFLQAPRINARREARTVLLVASPESIFFLFKIIFCNTEKMKIMLMLFVTPYWT